MGRALFVVMAAAVALGGCSGLQGLSKVSLGNTPSPAAVAQQKCQDRYAPVGAAAVYDCQREARLRGTEPAAAAGR